MNISFKNLLPQKSQCLESKEEICDYFSQNFVYPKNFLIFASQENKGFLNLNQTIAGQ